MTRTLSTPFARRRIVGSLLAALPALLPVALAAVATVATSAGQATPTRDVAAPSVAAEYPVGPVRLPATERVASLDDAWAADESAYGTRPDAVH